MTTAERTHSAARPSSSKERIALNQIRRDGGTQPRAGINDDHVERMLEALKEGHELPPVVVYFDGTDYWLADGFHRFTAHQCQLIPTIEAEIRQGDRRAAVLHSVGANRSHGLPRSRDDQRRAIETLLRDPEWGQWSNREIARQVGCSDNTVRDARNRLEASAQIAQIETRTVSRNGTTYTQAPKSQPTTKPAAKPVSPSALPATKPAPRPAAPAGWDWLAPDWGYQLRSVWTNIQTRNWGTPERCIQEAQEIEQAHAAKENPPPPAAPAPAAPRPAALRCRKCGETIVGTIAYSDKCPGCYHLEQYHQGDPTHRAFNLSLAETYTQRLPDSEFRALRLAKIEHFREDMQMPQPPPAAPPALAIPLHEELMQDTAPEPDRDAILAAAKRYYADWLASLDDRTLELLTAASWCIEWQTLSRQRRIEELLESFSESIAAEYDRESLQRLAELVDAQ